MKKILTLIILVSIVVSTTNAQSFQRILNPDYFIDDPLNEEFLYSADKSFEEKTAFFLDTFLVTALHYDIAKYIVGEDFKSEDFKTKLEELKQNPEEIEGQINACHWYNIDEDGDLDVIINLYFEEYKEGIIILAFQLEGQGYTYHQVPGILVTDAFYSNKIPNKILTYTYDFNKPLVEFKYYDTSFNEGPKYIASLTIPILLRKPLDEEYLKKHKDYIILTDSVYIFNEPDALLDTANFPIQEFEKQRIEKGTIVTAIAKVFYSGNFWLFVKAKDATRSDSEVWGWINAVNTDY
jgi:hypothetical protein